MEGLRERKKRETREAIAAAAMALFLEHGFDAVTVADVARAADVSEKTVFNYFATKEDLVFFRGGGPPRGAGGGDPHARARRAAVARLRGRDAGVPRSRSSPGRSSALMTVPRLVRAERGAARPAPARTGSLRRTS